MNRLTKKFNDLRRAHKKAFIAFITAGYPSVSFTEQLIHEFDAIGVDVLELGVPFTDPMADGPVIQQASFEALKRGINLDTIFAFVKRSRRTVSMPICLMTYYNPVFCYGVARFVKNAVAAGVDGVLIPDLPPEEAKELIAHARQAGLATIFFVAPTTSGKRIRSIVGSSTGFIYYVSLTGVTGARRSLPSDMAGHIRRIKKVTRLPVCVGFGVSTNQQVRLVERIADGVIVGSAIVSAIKESCGKPNAVKKIGAFVAHLTRSTRV
ncbi:MAG TPA: tryptophan synthase subunit alpha [Candidatus Omnitrophota bacterium]|nr:tryptophan synthase subunit alpha [Candidatus Omnitrophota bacterium]